MNCPDENIWFEVAAGALPDKESLQYLGHAATCDECGKKLKSAIQIFEQELSPEDERILEALPNNTTLKRLSERTNVSTLSIGKRKRSRWQSFSYAVATAVGLVLAIFLSANVLTDNLLARGYAERGSLEFRIVKANPPKEGKRGATIEEKERPVSLVLADLLIRARISLHPKSAYALAEKGRLELIEGRPSAALADLQEAHRLDPHSKTIAIDLASAYSQTGSKEDLFRAEDLLLSLLPFSKDKDDINLLRNNKDNIIVIYNLALLYELTGSFDKAINEWDLYLQLEATTSWSDIARKRLEELKTRKIGRIPPRPTAFPGDWVDYINSGEQNATETALEVAVVYWLPHRFRMPESAEVPLLRLADKLQKEHNDDWLSEITRTPPSAQLDQGFQSLKNAINFNLVGNFHSAVASALEAQQLFRMAGSVSGLVRSELEELYSYQRVTLGESCIHAAEQLQANLFNKNFLWIEIQLHLDKASCLNLLGRLQEAQMEAAQGLSIATSSDYTILRLRANGITTGLATTRGDHELALVQDITGLQEYGSNWYPVERAYQFYSDITFNAEGEGLWHVAYDMGEEAARTISQSSHKELEALTRYRLAKAAIMLGRKDAMGMQIEQADRLFTLLPQDESILRYRVDGVLGVAKAEADTGRYSDAILLLETYAAQFPPLETKLLLRRLYQLKGDLAFKLGLLEEAKMHYGSAVAIAESTLHDLRGAGDRLTWNRQNGLSYKSLAEVFLTENNDSAAFAVWQAYRGAVFRNSTLFKAADAFSNSPALDLKIPPIEYSPALFNPDEAFIAYSFLPRGPTAWLFDKNGMISTALGISTVDLQKLLQEFQAACATPLSDLDQLHIQGRMLYRVLLSPFAKRLSEIHTLIIQGDEELENIPFEALVTDSGSYLADQFVVSYSPWISFRTYARHFSPISSHVNALIIGAPQLRGKWANMLDPLPSAKVEIKALAAEFPAWPPLVNADATLSAVQDRLFGADIFHFAGHSIQTTAGVALLLAARDSQSSENDLLTVANLSPHRLRNLRLAFLSACSTDAQVNGGIGHLVQPFLWAGVPYTVATRWEIHSASAAQFAELFYDQLLKNQGPARSLKDVGIVLRSEPSTAHPFYWAAFMIWGVD